MDEEKYKRRTRIMVLILILGILFICAVMCAFIFGPAFYVMEMWD